MNILVFAGLFIFISLLLLLLAGLVIFKENGKKLLAVGGIVVLLVSAGITVFSYKTMEEVETKEKAAKEERVKANEERIRKEKEAKRLAAEQAERAAALEKMKAEEEKKKQRNGKQPEKKITDKKVAENDAPTQQRLDYEERMKIREWNELGRNLGDIEAELQQKIGEIERQKKQVSADYDSGKVNSYTKLKKQAELDLEKQELIIKAQDDKQTLLDGSFRLSDDDKRLDRALLEKRRIVAQEDRANCLAILRQVEENKGTFKSM